MNSPQSAISDPYAKTILDDQPIGYWRLSELSYADGVKDEVALNRLGQFVGTPQLGEPAAIKNSPNASMAFTPNNSLSIPSSPEFSIQTSGHGLTVEVWMKPHELTFPGEGGKKYIHWLGKGD